MNTPTTIYMAGLKYSLKEGHIRELLTPYGKIGEIDLVKDKDTGLKKGIAFVDIKYAEDAQKIISDLNNKIYLGRTLKVSVAKERFKKDEKYYASKARKISDKKLEESDTIEDEVKKPRRRRRDKGLKVLFDHLGK